MMPNLQYCVKGIFSVRSANFEFAPAFAPEQRETFRRVGEATLLGRAGDFAADHMDEAPARMLARARGRRKDAESQTAGAARERVRSRDVTGGCWGGTWGGIVSRAAERRGFP